MSKIKKIKKIKNCPKMKSMYKRLNSIGLFKKGQFLIFLIFFQFNKENLPTVFSFLISPDIILLNLMHIATPPF